MESTEKKVISVQTRVNAPINKVWQYWISPEAILRWNMASDDWHTTYAKNDVRNGGKFNIRMEARDGSTGFDFYGVYENVIAQKQIIYKLGDGRKVQITFSPKKGKTEIVEVFEAEKTNPIQLQRDGWQAILDNFKKYTEKDLSLEP